MSFFLLDRDRADGSLRILSSTVYETRDAAMAALSALAASGATTADHDVFIADLAAATPVLLVPQSPAPLSESASAWEAPAEESGGDELVVDEALAEPDAPEGLAGALRRAATSLESEGIVAPESVSAADDVVAMTEPAVPDTEESVPTGLVEDAPAPPGRPEPSADTTEDLAAAIASLAAEAPEDEPVLSAEEQVSEPMSVAEPEPAAPDSAVAAGEGWPWANVEPVAAQESSAGDVEVDIEVALEPVASVEEEAPDASEAGLGPAAPPEVEDESMIRGASIGEDEFVAPRAVIMGDYGADDAPASTPPGYEAGDVQLSDYTCEDCVYANTCPKAGESTPAECGSFQWKSV